MRFSEIYESEQDDTETRDKATRVFNTIHQWLNNHETELSKVLNKSNVFGGSLYAKATTFGLSSEYSDLIIMFSPKNENKVGGLGSVKGYKVIVLNVLLEPYSPKYLETRITGCMTTFIHEFTHYDLENRTKYKSNSAKKYDVDSQKYFNDPSELQAYYIEMTQDAAKFANTLISNKITREHGYVKELRGSTTKELIDWTKKQLKNTDFLNALTPENLKRIDKRLARFVEHTLRPILNKSINEMALPTEKVKSMIYYHGTPSETFAKQIVKKGIQPPDLVVDGKKKNNNMTPVEGKVYITPNLSYAVIYAIGGNFIGHSDYRVPYKGNEEKFKHLFSNDPTSRHYGRYGYVFKIDGDHLTDIQPDEDEIGGFLYHILNNDSDLKYVSDPHEKETLTKAMKDNYLKGNVLSLAKQYIADGTLGKIKDGEVEYWARAGKVIVKRMSDNDKIKMAEYGFHVAHTGAINPIECWKFDKTKCGYLNKDCSNFFELARKINVKVIATHKKW